MLQVLCSPSSSLTFLRALDCVGTSVRWAGAGYLWLGVWRALSSASCGHESSDKWRGGNLIVVGKGKASPSSNINSPLRAVMGALGHFSSLVWVILQLISLQKLPFTEQHSSPALFIQRLTLGWHHKGLSTAQSFFFFSLFLVLRLH